jgi:hypothetical protein
VDARVGVVVRAHEIEGAARRLVLFVPGRERSDQQAAVGSDHRRTRWHRGTA